MNQSIISSETTLALLSTKATVEKAFSTVAWPVLAVVEKGVFLGHISQSTLEGYAYKTLQDLAYLISPDAVSQQVHWFNYEIYFKKYKTRVLCLVGPNQVFLGYITHQAYMEALLKLPMFSETGRVLEVKKAAQDFSLVQLSQILAAAQLQVLGLSLVQQFPEVHATIKLGPGGIQELLASLRRYAYELVFIEGNDDYATVLKAHAAYLNTYLNI